MLESLPDRPLRRGEVRALEQSDAVTYTDHLAELKGARDDVVVGVYIGVRKTTYLLGFTAASGWVKIKSIDGEMGGGMVEAAGDAFAEWLRENYDSGEVTLTLDRSSVEELLLDVLPDRAVSNAEVMELDSYPSIDFLPLFALRESHEIVCVTTVEADLDGEITSVTAGFDPGSGWEVVSTEVIPPGEPADPEMDGVMDWVMDRYGDRVVAIDNRGRV